jgi:hypothetical protein
MAESDREKEHAKGGDAGELKVTDRRKFTLEGELRDGPAEEAEPTSETPPPAEQEERRRSRRSSTGRSRSHGASTSPC